MFRFLSIQGSSSTAARGALKVLVVELSQAFLNKIPFPC